MALGAEPGRGGRGGGGRPAPPGAEGSGAQNQTARGFKRLNLSDTRLSIDDDDLAWLENGMLVGRSVQTVPLYNGPAGAVLNAALIKVSRGFGLTYGANTVPHPVTIAVFEDGSAWMRDHYLDGAVDTQIAAVGIFGTSPLRTHITIWQDGPVLFLDEKAGYCKWDGTTFTVLDKSKLGSVLAVFEGHVWLLTAPRTFTYTAPNSFSDFTAGNGAGSFKITDEAFEGAVAAAVSTVEQLWILGADAIDALGNVATAAGVTTFTVTNAVSSLGTVFNEGVIAYYRSVVFPTGYSLHGLLGVTPQKLSAVLDRLFPQLASLLAAGPKLGVQVLNGRLCLIALFQFTDPVTGAVRSELLCFDEGKWFLCTTPDLAGHRVLDLVTLTIRTIPEVYGIDASGRLYRCFARATDPAQGTMTVSGKLFDFAQPVAGHQGIVIGLDLSAPAATSLALLTVLATTEATVITVSSGYENFLSVKDAPLGTRYALYRYNLPLIGHRMGWTLQVPCATGVVLEAAHLQILPVGEPWETVDPHPATWDFTGLAGVPFRFTGTAGVPFDWVGARST